MTQFVYSFSVWRLLWNLMRTIQNRIIIIIANTSSLVWYYFDAISTKVKLSTNFIVWVILEKGELHQVSETIKKMKHIEEFKRMCEKKKRIKETKSKAEGITNASWKAKQATLKMCFEKNKIWNTNDAKTIKVDTKIAKMIVLDDLLFHLLKILVLLV